MAIAGVRAAENTVINAIAIIRLFMKIFFIMIIFKLIKLVKYKLDGVAIGSVNKNRGQTTGQVEVSKSGFFSMEAI